MVLELMPHQKKALEELSNGKVLAGGVGVGKTITALVYFYTKVMGGVVGDLGSIKRPMDIYVFTTALKRDKLDWQEEAAHLCISTHRDSSVAGIKLTVDSYNNIGKYKDVKNAFIILDEQRMVGSGSWTKHFIALSKKNLWIMLSATPGDKWEDYIPLFVANGFYKNRTEFKREHCVYSYYGSYPKLERYINVGRLVRLENSILVKMPYERHTTRHIKEIQVDYDKQLFEKVVKKRWHVYENRPLKDAAELFSVMRKVANSDISRLITLQRLMQTHPRIIVFYNFDYELELLRSLSESVSNTEKEHQSQSSAQAKLSHEKTSRRFETKSESSSITDENLESLAWMMETEERLQSSEIGEWKNTGTNGTRSKKMEERLQNQNLTAVPSTISTSTSTNMKDDNLDRPTSTIKTKDPSRFQQMVTLNQHLKNGEVIGVDSPVSEFKIAEWNGHKHEPIPKSDGWIYLVQYAAGAEAWNCTDTNAVIFYSLTYSYKHFEQAQGRIDRLDTPYSDLYYYVLKSDSFIDRAILKALKHKKSFNEKEYGLNT